MLNSIGNAKKENVDNRDNSKPARRILVRPPKKNKAPPAFTYGKAPKEKRGGRKVRHRRDLKEKKNFYLSKRWKALRYDVLLKYGRDCMLCGITARPPHIDHIKPRSKFPELAYEVSNLQVLCAECNEGKSNRDTTDFRKAAPCPRTD